MTKIDVFSGFLGAGKTTLIKKLIKEAYKGEKLVLIENEFGDIGIDGTFLKDSGVQINEMNSGCICCSLVGDFSKALSQVVQEYSPDRILIEPSGVGKLSDVIKAVKTAQIDDSCLGSCVTVADVTKCKMYMKNFGEFYNDQIENAHAVIFSRTDDVAQDKIDTAITLVREHNPEAVIVTTGWDNLTGGQILEAMEHKNTLETHLSGLEHEHHHEHHHRDHDCECHHEHHHHDHDCECHHEHHHHDHDCECHHEHHHHDHDCECHQEQHHHEHHHADEVFTSWGRETTHKFSKENLEKILSQLDNQEEFGYVLRAKGVLQSPDGEWIHFDYVPDNFDIRSGSSDIIGRICVIGSKIDENKLLKLFEL